MIIIIDLSNSYKYELVFSSRNVQNSKYRISVSDKRYYDLFGYDKNIELKNITKENMYGDNKVCTYSSCWYTEGDHYEGTQGSGCGAGCGYKNGYKIINYNKNEDNLEIYIKYIYGESCIDDNKKMRLYAADSTNNMIDSVDYDSSFDINQYLDKYIDQLNTYKYIFKYDQEHNNYYFYSVEKVK